MIYDSGNGVTSRTGNYVEYSLRSPEISQAVVVGSVGNEVIGYRIFYGYFIFPY